MFQAKRQVPIKRPGARVEKYDESGHRKPEIYSEWEEPIKGFTQGSGKIMFACLEDFW